MEILLIILILSLKDDELSKKLTPMIDALINNKELISMLLKSAYKPSEKSEVKKEEKKEEDETPPRENGAASEAVSNFLNTYFK